jgi:hypothetical protein
MPRFTSPAPGCQLSLAVVNISLGLALPATAAARTPSTTQQAVAYSHCMRSHGVPRYPDPYSDGQLPKVGAQQLGVAVPGSSWPRQPAGACCRQVDRSSNRNTNACRTATAHGPCCSSC